MESIHITADWICIAITPIITFLVSAFKKIEIINKYPKWAALGLSTLSSFVGGLTYADLNFETIAACTVIPFLGSIGVYEVVVKPVSKNTEIK